MDDAQKLFDRADQQERDGDLVAALESWKKLCGISPTANVFLRLASLEEDLGHAAEAKVAYERAIEADRSSVLAYTGLALISLAAGEFEDAEVLASSALQYEEDAVAYCLRGLALDHLGKRDESATSFERALEIDPAYEEAYVNYGVLLRESNPVRAEQLFRSALQHCPDYAPAHRELGWLLSKVGNVSDGESHLRQAIQLDPGGAWAYVYLGNHLWRNGDAIAAGAEFERAGAAAPDQAFPLWSLASLYEDAEDWDNARRLYARALEIDPDDSVANMNFGRMLSKKGEKALAQRYLLKALSLDPDYDAARRLLSEL